jgi:hypothetical protein
MLADPITIAANSPNPEIKLAIIKQDGYGSERTDTNGGGYSTLINHTTVKAGRRHYLKLSLTKDATDPYTALTKSVQASVSLSIARPPNGFSDTDIINLVKAFTDTLADSEVTPAKLIQQQS